MKNGLIVFVKNPVPGRVKTRLAASIGHKEAAVVYRSLTETLYKELAGKDFDLFFFVDHPDGKKKIENWLKPLKPVKIQKGRDLGERMFNAFRQMNKMGYKKIAIVGTDAPGVTAGIVKRAFGLLGQVQAVLGPTFDGGYFLLALTKPVPALFQGIAWSTGKVFQQTLKHIRKEKLRYRSLKKLRDIDTIQDLRLENIPYPSRI